MIKKYTWLKAALLASLLMIGGGAVYYYYHTQSPKQPIYEYEAARDKEDIQKLFDNNWYWLISSDDYSVNFMLDRRAPNQYNPRYFGKLQIQVMRVNNEFVGFVAYYMKNFYLGQLLFIAVKQDQRGKGYAKVLMNYALEQLKEMGATKVKLVTRPTNLSAIAVYNKTGFTEINRDDEFVYFEKRL